MKPTEKPRGGRQDAKNFAAFRRIAGLSAVSALFAAAPNRIERLFFEERMKSAAGPICAGLARQHKRYQLVEADELARIAGTPMHGGMVAIAKSRPIQAFSLPAARMWAQDGKPLLILDGVGNPHNLGAIARIAAFFGVPRMIISDHPMQAGLSDASYRVAEGGLEHIEVYRAEHIASTVKQLHEFYHVVATALGTYTPLSSLHASAKPVALILGNEEDGVPASTQKACNAIVTIPGSGYVQSLNVAASAAIFLHAITDAPSLQTAFCSQKAAFSFPPYCSGPPKPP